MSSDRHLRYPIGSAMLLAVAGIVAIDLKLERPILSPVLLGVLGVLAFVEIIRFPGAVLPPSLRRIAIACGVLMAALPLVMREQTHRDVAWSVLLALPLSLFVVAVAGLRLRWRTPIPASDGAAFGVVALGLSITVLPLVLLSVTTLMEHGVALVALLVIGSKLNDIGGYVFGSTLGRHRLCPPISPNKSVEGAVGGAFLGILGTVLLGRLLPGLSDRLELWELLILGGALALATQTGDLFESLLKRAASVKDSGRMLPAFGGAFDLIDSFIFVGPLGYTLGVLFL